MKRVVFRSLGLLVGVLFLFGTGGMVLEGRYKDAVMMGCLGVLFTTYGAFGEHRIQWMFAMLFGGEYKPNQKSGRGKFTE
ncbi:hypothetical protein J8F10_24395 [Gemmata sp. G18]|uniref:DUF2892 domain-containing protein n=1 Tax=Gemmata palustris TaxID=2822762 RepID=A0ABS5BXD8_9BACT|nr:hypothetical protein [Gemmata palustris]MBP3958402.1 hypothetical protein [Gemmata palustris]